MVFRGADDGLAELILVVNTTSMIDWVIGTRMKLSWGIGSVVKTEGSDGTMDTGRGYESVGMCSFKCVCVLLSGSHMF